MWHNYKSTVAVETQQCILCFTTLSFKWHYFQEKT